MRKTVLLLTIVVVVTACGSTTDVSASCEEFIQSDGVTPLVICDTPLPFGSG